MKVFGPKNKIKIEENFSRIVKSNSKLSLDIRELFKFESFSRLWPWPRIVKSNSIPSFNRRELFTFVASGRRPEATNREVEFYAEL